MNKPRAKAAWAIPNNFSNQLLLNLLYRESNTEVYQIAQKI